jgi:hypothetical protein
VIFSRARRIRDQMLTAPVRHAPLTHALGEIMRQALHDLSRHPRKFPNNFSRQALIV